MTDKKVIKGKGFDEECLKKKMKEIEKAYKKEGGEDVDLENWLMKDLGLIRIEPKFKDHVLYEQLLSAIQSCLEK